MPDLRVGREKKKGGGVGKSIGSKNGPFNGAKGRGKRTSRRKGGPWWNYEDVYR